MGERLSKLLLLLLTTTTTTTLGGCSLIYSADRLPPVTDAPPDTPLPVDCTGLKLERVFPTELLEGQGDGGGRQAVLLIHGTNIAPNATIEIVPHAGETNTPLLALDRTMLAVDSWGLRIAVPVKLSVDANIGASKAVRLDVKVSQPCEATGGTISASLDQLEGDAPVLNLRGLDELTGMANLSTAKPHLFSRVDATTINATDATNPLIVRSTSSITISGAGPHDFNGVARNPGPGGGLGGAGGQIVLGSTAGGPGGGDGGGKTAGGGGGFATKGMDGATANTGGNMVGEASLAGWDRPNRGCGGAGGDGGLAVGGVGGGGGGALELTAAGDLTINGTIEARGGDGTTGGSAGGGGSGGAVLLRAGGSNISVGGVVATGGGGPGNAGDGAPGRVRFDSPSKTTTFTSMPEIGYRGPMFATATPMVVRESQPRLTIVGQPGGIKYTIESAAGETLGPFDLTIPSSGETTFSLQMPLFEGYNKLCAMIVSGMNDRRDEAENCTTLAYLFQRL